ncbi:MAG: class I SAM-dependent methyltransferase [Planctomycetota bacterium]|nr:class I SAM-dependent methyltransferase [Planctomycetota bacterium]
MPNSRTTAKPPLTRATSDRHLLYQAAVQASDAEIDFITHRFKQLRKRPARLLREDFCGTALSACEFVRRHKDNHAVGLDLHQPTLDWGLRHNVAKLPDDARARISLLNRNVLSPTDADRAFDIVEAMNFSYWIFTTRPRMLDYFRTVRASLKPDGVFFLDFWGGYESMREQRERRRISRGVTYIWDQHHYDPISGIMTCYIHFEFKRGPAWNRAFTYVWRLWTLPEIRELLAEAGFKNVTVYWEGENEHGNGTGYFHPRKKGVADASFICYLSAEK